MTWGLDSPTTPVATPRESLVELRLLEGPNLYFPRAAVKLTLDAAALTGIGAAQARRLAADLGLARVRPGDPGTGQRQAFTMRLLRHVVRRVARESGTSRLAVRARPGAVPEQVVVAYPWRHAGRAEALGRAVAELLDRALDAERSGAGVDLGDLATLAAGRVSVADLGRAPDAVRPRIPVASITGTNGKTTTTRLLAHLCMTAGLRTGWSSTDGVVVQGEMVEPGDYSGPAGGRRVLQHPGVQVAVLETARGGLLLRGMGVVANDVSVVTNVTADHLGLQGIDTLDQLAEVKAVVTKVTKRTGWVVLNGDDPRVLAMMAGSPAQPFVFSLDAESPALRRALDAGGRAMTVLDGDLSVLSAGSDPDRLLPVLDVPITLSGLSEHNVANALAATAAGLSLGLPRSAVLQGLRTFRPDPALNPGRMNLYTAPVEGGSVTVVVDLAHNEAGLEALLRVARGVTAPGGRLLLGLGAVGDRTDELLVALGEMAALGADRVAVVHKAKYLRGRSVDELESLLRRGAAAAGVYDVPSHPSELAGVQGLLAEAGPGDVVAVMVHADRPMVHDWLLRSGAVVDDPDAVRRKVVAARGQHPLEDEISAVRALPAAERLASLERLRRERPDDPRLAFEHGTALDAIGDEAAAVPLYREALDLGLAEPHQTAARVQLASSLRVLGHAGAALRELDAILAHRPSSTAAAAFRALVLHDLGRHDQALGQALSELAQHLAGGDAEGYAAALQHYAAELTNNPRGDHAEVTGPVTSA